MSRADLVNALSGGHAAPRTMSSELTPPPQVPTPQTVPAGQQENLSATHFRTLVEDHGIAEAHRRALQHQSDARRRHEAVSFLINHHIADETWNATLQDAARAAANGEKEFLLLRFPSDLWPDGGRAINAPEDGWPASLRGEASEVYLRWEHDLQPRGFHIAARILTFPDGMPGDIGVFLTWGSRGSPRPNHQSRSRFRVWRYSPWWLSEPRQSRMRLMR